MGRPPHRCRPGNTKDKIDKPIIKGVMSNGGKIEKKTKSKKVSDAQSRGQSQSCHQCRQSIHSNKGLSEVKQGKARLKCSSCTRFWCEQCLLNRYGVVKDEADPTTWSCPVCQKICNCSLCRRKEGKLATGILTPLVKNSGFESVSDFLDKGTTDIAKVLQWSSPSETDGQGKKQPKHSPSQSAVPKSRPKTSTHRKSCRNVGQLHTHKGPNSLNSDETSLRKKNHREVSTVTNENDEHFSDNPNSTNFTPHSASTSKDQSQYRRSTRKRKQSCFYATEDFRRDSVSPERSPSVESVARFRSPLCYVKSPNELSPTIECVPKSDKIIEKSKLPEELQVETINQKMVDYQQKIKLENQRSREEKCLQKKLLMEERAKEREVRAEERKRMIAEKAHASEKLKLSKIGAREKFKLAQGVKRQALKKIQRLQKEKEKVRKQELLADLKEKTKVEKWKRLKLATTPFSVERTQVTLLDDNVEECLATGVPSLPSLPLLTLPRIPVHLTPNILFVGEFLHTFSRPLGLKRQLTVTQLAAALASGRGMSDVYLALLRVLLDEKVDLKKELRTSKKQRDLEKVAKLYLARNNINGFVPSPETETRAIDESVQLLDHLCHKALCSAIITEFLDSTKERQEQLRKEQRTIEKEATKRFGERLKALCDEGGSIEEIKQQREHFTEDLILLRQTFKEELAGCFVERNNSLGMDRHNRLYWRLQSFPCLLVEAHPVTCGDEDTCWYKVDKQSLLDQLLASLHPAGSREKPLYKSLSSLRDTIND